MQSVKPTIPKRIKTLHCKSLLLLVLFSTAFISVFSQDNSPYSRYGLGDIVPSTNISARGMGGLSAAYKDYWPSFSNTINFNNPATYASFEAGVEARSKKLTYGRAILDIGLNIENRTLKESNPAKKFTANNVLFSHVQVGFPLRKNWGLSFGIRPMSRISYKLFRGERIKDPVTGAPIDTVTTRFEGDGGSYLVSGGTGFNVFTKQKSFGQEALSVGINVGYLFGKKDHSTRREFRNDTVQYFSGNFQSKTNFGSVYVNAGLYYRNFIKKSEKWTGVFSAGVYGSLGHNLSATQDRIRETFIYDASLGDIRLDSVSDIKDIKGDIKLPASITGGFTLQKFQEYKKTSGWIIGLDVMYQGWKSYRFYGQEDSLRNKWEVRLGGQVSPIPRDNYFSRVAYRGGFIFGPDYVNVQNKLPQMGITFGLGLPVGNYNRLSPNLSSLLNIAFEYIKRGNDDNLVKENMFRVSVGFSLSDMWFIKRKYD
jgi:hypothetical protein